MGRYVQGAGPHPHHCPLNKEGSQVFQNGTVIRQNNRKRKEKKQTKKKEMGTQDRKESTGRIAIQIYNRRVNGRRMSEQERR